ncbi:uncharacterized protein B0I36DRAFT_354952 [Microdochium trichocladiopsis]|uniref:Uncharacterized protein n=1 Tax=Microdochium trichocladiopsis TaxID=1682393 RepID=A0A9P8XT39_9PEZI|nr:uncharacterized protein B0I36DRAFT_369730 [Microdochium trichocladiopsis]XP_046005707.1 uncharacterized protein B0I36DRAFT_354952 [Microdochium trichocladiopsis]KAH7012581.1 hypothetical protein B0I36DRAFT_369730 [Microdochium trichocladiopsis]KAH7016083.1 hypothetical protein B0I36DRAFT_354952 [Microdochium trichocladiopsis]
MDPGTLAAITGGLFALLSKFNNALEGYLEQLKKKQQAKQILMSLKEECDITQVIASNIKDAIDKVSGQGSSAQNKLVNAIRLMARELGALVKKLTTTIEDIFKLGDIGKIGNALVQSESLCLAEHGPQLHPNVIVARARVSGLVGLGVFQAPLRDTGHRISDI